MALISGMPTVIGGVSDDEFLKSIEVLDNSADEEAQRGVDWRIAAHHLSRPRYTFSFFLLLQKNINNKELMSNLFKAKGSVCPVLLLCMAI